MSNTKIKNILKNKKKLINKSMILCIGDIILDNNINGVINRISPEAPIPILLIKDESYHLGGAGNVAKNIASLGGNVTLLYLSNKKKSSTIVCDLLKKEKKINSIEIKVDDFDTPLKKRYKNNLKQILRVDNENDKFILNKKTRLIILKILKNEIKKYNLIILSDYNKGLLDKNLIQEIIKIANKNNITIVADPKKKDLSSYANANLITPNEKEITDAAKKKSLSEKQIIAFSNKIIKENNIHDILTTRSNKGMLLVNKEYTNKFIACAKKVVDVTGAGDTVIGVLSLMLAIGVNKKDAVMISNYAAGLVIGKYGTETIKLKDLLKLNDQ